MNILEALFFPFTYARSFLEEVIFDSHHTYILYSSLSLSLYDIHLALA